MQQSLIAASVGVTVVCLIAWLLDLLQILELRAGWGNLLWSVLIASVLGNSALIYRRFSTKSNTVEIVCLRPLVTVAVGKPHILRSNSVYSRLDSFAFFVFLRDGVWGAMEQRTDLSRSLPVKAVVFGRERRDIAAESGKLME